MVETELKQEYDLCFSLVKHRQYGDALDRIKGLVARTPSVFADILSGLYKRLTSHFDDVELRLMIAGLYIHMKAVDAACDELENALDFSPHHPQIFYFFNKIYKQCSQKTVIQTVFENAFSEGVVDTSIIDLLPVIYMEQKAYKSGILFFEKLILEKGQSHIHFRKSLCEFYLKAGRLATYAGYLLEIIQDAPDDVGHYILECQSVLDEHPDSLELRQTLVVLLIKGLRPNDAVLQIQALLGSSAVEPATLVKSLKYLLSVFPDHPEARLILSDCYIAMRQYLDAVDLLRELVDTLGHEPVFKRLTQILIQQPEFSGALELVCDLHFTLKNFSRALSVVSTMMACETRDDAFISKRLREILREAPDLEFECRHMIALHAQMTEDWMVCDTESRRLLGSDYDLEGRLMIARVYEQSSQFSDVHEMLFSAVDRHSNDVKIHNALKAFQGTAIHRLIEQKTAQTFVVDAPPEHHFSLGLLYLNHGLLYPALDHFQKLTQHPTYMIDAQILISRSFMEMGRYDLSLNQLTRLMQKVSEFDYPLRNRLAYLSAVSLLHIGNPHEALNQLEFILGNDVKFPNVQHILSQLKEENLLDFRGLIVTGCSSFISEGSPEWSLMAVHNPENDDLFINASDSGAISFAHPHNQQGVLALLKDNVKTAEESFKLAIQMDPKLTAAFCNLAMVKLVQQELDAALYYLSKAQALNPKLDAIYITKGLIYAAQNQWDFALTQFEACLAINPKHGIALLNLGDIFYQLEDIPSALQYWKKALDSGLLFPFLHRRLYYLNPKIESPSVWTTDYKLSFVPFYQTRHRDGAMKSLVSQSQYSGMPLFDFLESP